MLERTTSAPVWSPVRRVSHRLWALTGLSSGLLRYVLIAAVLCGIACVYLWQVNDLSSLHEDTLELQYQASVLEEKNVILAEQLAKWNSPAYVDKLSVEAGYVVAPPRTIDAPAGIGREAPSVAAVAPGTTR
jgi:hypothetical protein